jgi:hypothetical protein
MNDEFLHSLRRAPAPEFAKALHARLTAAATPHARPSTSLRTTRWLALAASVAAVAFAFTLPSVRAGAEAFLDLFRVSSFTGVAFDASNLRKFDGTSVDVHLIGDQIEVLEEAAPPVSYASADEAGAAADLTLMWPAYVPSDWRRTDITVGGGNAVRVTASTAKLEALLADLGLGDVLVPAGLDGAEITVRVPPIAVATYDNGGAMAHLAQARSPEVLFPAGLDLGALAEIGLRILGLDADEAYRLAYSVDWRSTLLVPVPTNAARFRQVDVAGHGGLSIEAVREDGHFENVLLWSLDDRVLVLSGPLAPLELLEMAQSLQ